MIKHINGNEFDAFVSSNEKVVIDFWASWCGPCRMLGQELEELDLKHPEIVVGKVNVDENEACFAQFGEQAIPLLCFFKNGKLVKKIVGYIPADRVWETYNG